MHTHEDVKQGIKPAKQMSRKTFTRVVIVLVCLSALISMAASSVYHTPNYAMIGVGFNLTLLSFASYYGKKAKDKKALESLS